MEIFFAGIFIFLLAVHSYTDFKAMLLYDKVTLCLAAVGFVRAIYVQQLTLACQNAGLLLLVMLLVYFASRGGMGEGDVKLAPALGLWLSLSVEQGLLCLLLAFVSGSIAGVGLLLLGKSKKSALPFGPFLCAGAIAAYFWSEQLIACYWQIVLS